MSSDIPDPETPSNLPSPPFIAMRAIPNFRDLGGYQIANATGRSFRRDYIFRCGEPTKATSEDVEKIRSLNITRIYDLRSHPEIMKHQVSGTSEPYSWEGVERIYAPVFPEQSWDPVSMAVRHNEFQSEDAEGMASAYRTIALEGAQAYGQIIRHILSQPPPGNSFIIHCTAGKDRTGVLGALLLQLAGVPDEIIVQEYSLTNQGLGEWSKYLIQVVVKQTSCSEEAAKRMTSARAESMSAFLKWLRSGGGAEAYFKKECNLTDEELEQVKRTLVVEEEPVTGLKN